MHALMTRLLAWITNLTQLWRTIVPNETHLLTPVRLNDRQPLFEDAHDQLDATAFAEAVQSRNDRSLEVVPMGDRTSSGYTERRLTPNGFAMEEVSTVCRAIQGHVFSQEQFLGGGQCSECHGYADRDHFCLCALCARGLCMQHTIRIEGIPLCPEHARAVFLGLDSWAYQRNGRRLPW